MTKQEKIEAIRAGLVVWVTERPGDIQVWDAQHRKLSFTLLSVHSEVCVVTTDPDGTRGVCGTVPIAKWLLAGSVRLWLVETKMTGMGFRSRELNIPTLIRAAQ